MRGRGGGRALRLGLPFSGQEDEGTQLHRRRSAKNMSMFVPDERLQSCDGCRFRGLGATFQGLRHAKLW